LTKDVEIAGTEICQGKVFIANFTFGATSLFIRLLLDALYCLF